MAHTFKIHKESLRRKFAVYVVVAKSDNDTKLYVGKTGDNRDGCNPMISRCGNHFSYNRIHSQIRNHVYDHESHDYTYVFDHFDEYLEDRTVRQSSIDKINEMERWLNEKIATATSGLPAARLVNPFKGTGALRPEEKVKRYTFRTPENEAVLDKIVEAVKAELR